MSETSEYSYELCGPDPTEDLYWLRQRGRPVIRRSTQISSQETIFVHPAVASAERVGTGADSSDAIGGGFTGIMTVI